MLDLDMRFFDCGALILVDWCRVRGILLLCQLEFLGLQLQVDFLANLSEGKTGFVMKSD